MGERFIGIDIGGTKCAVVLGDENAHILGKIKFKTTTVTETLSQMMKFTESFMEPEVKAIGISCGGPLDDKEGVILSPPNLQGWDRIPITQLLTKQFHVPVYLKNDADACAIAEWKYGAGRGCRNVIFLTFGTGMGAGLILNGGLYSGTCNMAGEIGHMRIYEKGHIGYGKEGSFEGYCSGGGIAQYGLGDARVLHEKALAGDQAAIRLFEKIGEDLGKGVAVLLDLLNPEVVIIGSIYTRAREFMEPSMQKVLKKETLQANLESARIVPSQLGEQLGDMAALGVASYG